MANEFDGILEKIKRAKENILNLQSEIEGFFQKSEHPVFSKDDNQLLLKQIEYHRNLPIPLRFAVLAGEAIHHHRSCFDHIAWLFSSVSHRASKEARFIEFPILEKRPTKDNLFTSYERKIKGITDVRVRNLIEKLQPYNTANPVNSLLHVIHQFDVMDKHKELVIVTHVAGLQVPIEIMRRYVTYVGNDPAANNAALKEQLKSHAQMLPDVAFRNFLNGETEPVIQGLMMLQNFTVECMKRFDILP